MEIVNFYGSFRLWLRCPLPRRPSLYPRKWVSPVCSPCAPWVVFLSHACTHSSAYRVPFLADSLQGPSSLSCPARTVLTWAQECVLKEHRTLEAPLRWLWCSVSLPGLSWKFSTIVLIQPRNLFSMTNLVSFQIVEYLCFPLHHGAGDSQE